MRKYINQFFNVHDSNGELVRAKVLDVEFETGFGPIFIMKSSQGQSFWVTLKELKESEMYQM